MAEGMSLSGAVIFVRELHRSEDFYRQLFELDVEIAEPESVLLLGPSGDHLFLRARGEAGRMPGGVGVQYLIWTARDAADLDRCEEVLKARGAFRSTTIEHGITVVEGHDPDNIPVLVTYPAGPGVGMTSVPTRLYAY
jgi:hypothetical protein